MNLAEGFGQNNEFIMGCGEAGKYTEALASQFDCGCLISEAETPNCNKLARLLGISPLVKC